MANKSKIIYGILLRVVIWYILGIQNSMCLPFVNKLNWISRHSKERRQLCDFQGSSQTFKLQKTMGSCPACSHHLNDAPDTCSRSSLKKRLCALHVKVKFLLFIHQITSFIILIYLSTWYLISHVTYLRIIFYFIPSLNYQKTLLSQSPKYISNLTIINNFLLHLMSKLPSSLTCTLVVGP